MARSILSWRLSTTATVALFIGAWTATSSGQLQQNSTAALPAIDRGLRDQDPPRPARTAANLTQARSARSVERAYVRGSLIVKFKEGTGRSAINAATAQVAGAVA